MAWLAPLLLVALVLFSVVAFCYRFLLVIDRRRPKLVHGKRGIREGLRVLIVLGSGGHTTEMIAMLERAVSEENPQLRLEWSRFTNRSWVLSSGDAISAERARTLEKRSKDTSLHARPNIHNEHTAAVQSTETYEIFVVPRAREIHQPLITAPWSSLKCLWACVQVLTGSIIMHPQGEQDFPDLILCNGPATATILVLASILLRIFNFRGCHSRGKMRTVYVESWARVKTLSLSGILLSRVVDRFLVQWPQLEELGGRVEYIGVLV